MHSFPKGCAHKDEVAQPSNLIETRVQPPRNITKSETSTARTTTTCCNSCSENDNVFLNIPLKFKKNSLSFDDVESIGQLKNVLKDILKALEAF